MNQFIVPPHFRTHRPSYRSRLNARRKQKFREKTFTLAAVGLTPAGARMAIASLCALQGKPVPK